MRVTGNMLSSNLLGNLYTNLKSLNKYQNQISANRKILRLSDDPVGAVSSFQIESDINKSEQMSKNISDAQSWLTQTETSLSDINSLLTRAKELVVSAGNGTYTSEQRTAIKEELQELQTHFVDLANTKFVGKYIFGGYNTTSQPFTLNEDGTLSYNSITDIANATDSEIQAEKSQIRQYNVSTTTKFDVSISGIQLVGVGDENIYNLFDGLINCIENDDVTGEIASYGEKFSNAQSKILTLLSDVGGRQTGLDIMAARYESENINLNELYTKVAGIDQAEVITQEKMAENTYNAALQVGAKIIQNSLVDFLR